MKIDSFWENQLKKWNEEKKCGFCWNWHGFTTLQGINNGVDGKGGDCCVDVFITNETFRKENAYNPNNPYAVQTNCVDSYSIWFLFRGEIELNCNDEQKLQNLRECLSCGVELDMCEAMGFVFRVNQWRGESYRMYTDNNYWGWRIFVEFATNER